MKYAAHCNSLYVFNNMEELKSYFTIMCYGSDGKAKKFYGNVLKESESKAVPTDNTFKDCLKIAIKDYKGSNENIFISLNERMSIDDTIKHFENMIQPILDVCNDYNVRFNNGTPFEDFGSDEDSAYGGMYSISKFYQEILKKFDIYVDSIETTEKSDGSYIITINDKEKFDMDAWDKIENVIDNIESMIETLKVKEGEMSYE